MLHKPEIPDNTGNVGRTCVAVGAKLWLVRPLGFRLDDRHLRRAGLDYWEHLDWEAATTGRRCGPGCGSGDCGCSASTPPGRTPMPRSGRATPWFSAPNRAGLPPSLLAQDPSGCLRIPMRAEARSLNLAVSVAVAAFEALRQFGPSLWPGPPA